MRILVLGASGMLGSQIIKRFNLEPFLHVYGCMRNLDLFNFFPKSCRFNLIKCGDLSKTESIFSILDLALPDVVINCAGLTKHKEFADNPKVILPINATMPHQFAAACDDRRIRFIHISSDCVFSGHKGGYVEDDIPDALDLYGKSKMMGEVVNGNALTLRTSMIGHELHSSFGLLEWFLNQNIQCSGFSKVIFSGLPTVVIAEIILEYVLPNPNLKGLYHVSADPINKYDLLKLIAGVYGKNIQINKNCDSKIDRSLNYQKFKSTTGYTPADWLTLIRAMHENKKFTYNV